MSTVEADTDTAVMHNAWWQRRHLLHRFISDLIADELARLRRNASVRRSQPWSGDLKIDKDLGADSLELMHLATTLAEAIHLHESGIEDYLLMKRSLADWVDVAHAGLDQFSERLTFRTSGSSGTPKPCMHPLSTLLQEADELGRMFAGRKRLLFAVPSHHIYGFLFTVLLAQKLGLQPNALIDMRNSSPARLAQCMQPGDLVIAYPEFWQAVARTVPQFPSDVIGVTSTGPCADHISEAVERAGIVHLFHVYGSSETAGIGWRSSFRDPYRLFPHWSFDAVPSNRLLRTLPDGTSLRTTCQDALDRQSPQTFLVGVRHDTAVQVGGINVFPAYVSSVLRRHPMVQDAAVRLMRPDEGNRLKAYVVVKPEVVDTLRFLAEFTDWIDQELSTPERPKSVQVGARLPSSASGKPCDWDTDVEALA